MNTSFVLLQVHFLPCADISAREQFPVRIEAFTVTKNYEILAEQPCQLGVRSSVTLEILSVSVRK
jgi:hypothetical protein